MMTGARLLRGAAQGLLVLVATIGVVASACTSDRGSPAAGQTHATSAEVRVTSLDTVSQLRDRFNEDVGKVRLVLLLSPT